MTQWASVRSRPQSRGGHDPGIISEHSGYHRNHEYGYELEVTQDILKILDASVVSE